MARSLDERVALLEDRLDTVRAQLSGGPGVTWEQSIRGRLHTMQTTLSTADSLEKALREVRRDRAKMWHTWQKVLAGVCLLATAVAPYVAIALHR